MANKKVWQDFTEAIRSDIRLVNQLNVSAFYGNCSAELTQALQYIQDPGQFLSEELSLDRALRALELAVNNHRLDPGAPALVNARIVAEGALDQMCHALETARPNDFARNLRIAWD